MTVLSWVCIAKQVSFIFSAVSMALCSISPGHSVTATAQHIDLYNIYIYISPHDHKILSSYGPVSYSLLARLALTKGGTI